MEKLLLRIALSFCLIFGAYALNSNTNGGFTSDLTGSPLSSSTCQTSCHSTFGLNSGSGSVSMSVPATYYPGSSYTVSLTVNETVPKYGFMAGVLRDDNTNGGTFSNGVGSSATTIAGRSYTRHSSINNTGTWNFDWTAPSYEDTISFYFVGNAANSAGGNSGDYIYTSSVSTFPMDLITFDTTITSTSCFSSCDGSISITNVTGGAGAPYSYDWSNNLTTASISSLCAGNFTVTITDNAGNEEVSTLTVGSSAPIISNITSVGSSCTGGSGSASVAPMGGAGGYTYQWNTGSTDSLIQNLALGMYFITITDAAGCTQVDSTEVVELGSGLLADITVTDESCGQANGSISVNMINGTSPHSYTWNTGATTAVLNNLNAGSYTVTVTDAAGCEETFSETVGEEVVIIDEAASTVEPLVCPGIASGSIDVVVSEGAQPFVYDWSNGATTASITSLFGGTYSVTVTDQNGCTDEASFEVIEPDSIEAVADLTHPFGGGCDGAISITALGGTGAFSYTWSHDASATGATLTDLCPGNYSITVSDANGCNVILEEVLDEGLGLDGIDESAIRLFPNPAKDELFLQTTQSEILEVTLTDMTGRRLQTWENGFSNGLDLSGFTTGRYNLFIISSQGLVRHPLLIHR